MSSNNRKNYGKDISSINTPIKFHLPDGGTKLFQNSQDAQSWFNQNYASGYSMVEHVPIQGDSEHPIELDEIVVTAPASKKSTPSKKGVDMWAGANYSPSFNKHFYGTSDFDALFGKSRVEGVKKAWQRNPKAMQNWTDGGNVAAAFITAPFAAYAAGEYALPWLAQNALYLSARGWLGATQAAGNTPAWLTPASATAIDATMAGIGTGASINDMRQNGPTVGNVIGTTLGVGGLALEAVPTVMEGYNVAKSIYDNGTLWDKYTTLGGRFGYYGNPLQRAWGTISRNLGIPSAPKHPELLRKLEGLPKVTEEGLLDFNSTRTGLLGEGHSNWTLDRPVVSHGKGNWDGKDLFIVDPAEFQKAISKENVISIEPSDMFVQNANAVINPKRVTVVSGNPETLVQARQMGMSTLSSPKLRRLYRPEKPKVGRFSLDKGNYGNHPYALEQQRLQQRRGVPTIEDFRLIEDQYGLKAGVIPMSEYLQNPLSTAVENMLQNPTQIGTWTYPNGREVQLIPGGTYLDKAIQEQSLVNKAPYRNVFYDPASHVEVNSGVTNRGKK